MRLIPGGLLETDFTITGAKEGAEGSQNTGWCFCYNELTGSTPLFHSHLTHVNKSAPPEQICPAEKLRPQLHANRPVSPQLRTHPPLVKWGHAREHD